jgi:hypothetical protein
MRRTIVIALVLLLSESAPAQTPIPAILDTIQHTAFNYFWYQANPANGLIKDRSSSNSPCSIASTGFGLSAICIGVDHGWVTRAAARDRVLTTLRTFWYGPQGSGDGYIGNFGLFYHMLDMNTATRTWSSELSTIDSGLLLAGIVDAQQYFDGTDSLETSLRAYADSISMRMQWSYMRGPYPFGLALGWMPGTGFSGYGEWKGYNEASIMYILAMGSPFVPNRLTQYGWTIWTSGYSWINYAGYQYVSFPPLFGHQYSQCWLDLRAINDDYMTARGITYFENSRRATLAQRAYSRANPGGFTGYSDSLWGITASDVQGGYAARGAPPAQNDDGTIAPTAPISSIPFASDSVIPAIRNMWENYRTQLWTPYGFRDAFNLRLNWWDTDIVGIDQGPEIIMIENYLNGRVWKRFMKNADVQRGLAAANFLPVTGIASAPLPGGYNLSQNYPNPFNPATEIRFTLPEQSRVSLKVFDLLGCEIATLVDGTLAPGAHAASFDGRNLSSGVYIYRLTALSLRGAAAAPRSNLVNTGAFTASRSMLLVR